MRLGRARFTKVIDTQLALFEREHHDLIDAIDERLTAYNRAERSEAEELYGDYADAVDEGIEILQELRDNYAESVDDPDRYVKEFNRAVARRLPRLALDGHG